MTERNRQIQVKPAEIGIELTTIETTREVFTSPTDAGKKKGLELATRSLKGLGQAVVGWAAFAASFEAQNAERWNFLNGEIPSDGLRIAGVVAMAALGLMLEGKAYNNFRGLNKVWDQVATVADREM